MNPLVERAVLGLLRICQRLLPYKEDTADTLLRSLRLVIGLASAVSWELAERIAGEVGHLTAPLLPAAGLGARGTGRTWRPAPRPPLPFAPRRCWRS